MQSVHNGGMYKATTVHRHDLWANARGGIFLNLFNQKNNAFPEGLCAKEDGTRRHMYKAAHTPDGMHKETTTVHHQHNLWTNALSNIS